MASNARQRGAVTVTVVIVLVMLLGFLGLALDWGYTLWVAGQLQNAADASALAGAQQVYDSHSAARTAAINIASANYAAGSVQLWPNPTNESDGDVVVGFYDADTRTFTATDQANANAVYVLARRNEGAKAGALPLFFGPIFGKDTADVVRFAIAVAEGGPNYASVIALNPSDPKTFHLQGNAALFVSGAVQVDSTHRQAAYYNGTPITFTADEVNIVGEHDIKGRPNLPDQNDFEPYVADPLADLPQPAVPGSATYPAKPKITGSGEFHPGFYPGGLDLKAGNNVFLHPGVYILNTGFATNGHSTLTGYGVMFFLNQGSVHDNGTGQVYITPPTEGVYENIQFFQARTNTEQADFNGTTLWTGAQTDDPSTPDVDETAIGSGTFYFPKAKVDLGGTGDMYLNGLIADKIEVYGTGDKYVTDGYESDEGTRKVYLVE
jgi:hypothetical protein